VLITATVFFMWRVYVVTHYNNRRVNAMTKFKSLIKVIVAVIIYHYVTAYAYGDGTCSEENCTNGQGYIQSTTNHPYTMRRNPTIPTRYGGNRHE